MPEIVLTAERSLTTTTADLNGNINTDTLYIGRDENNAYRSYLYFDTSSLSDTLNIVSVSLILPIIKDFYPCCKKCFFVYPLTSDFGDYTTFLNFPTFGSPYTKMRYLSGPVEIDITNIVSNWINNNLVNYGLMIKGTESSCSLMTFGSAINPDPNLVPKLRIIYSLGPKPVPSLVNFKEKNFTLSNTSPTSTSTCVGTFKDGTFFITRTDAGTDPLTFTIQVSADGTTWVTDSSDTLTNGSIALVPLYFGKCYRLIGSGAGTWNVNVKFVYQYY